MHKVGVSITGWGLVLMISVGVLKAIQEAKITGKNIIADMLEISKVVDEEMGGTSGALYSCATAYSFHQDIPLSDPHEQDFLLRSRNESALFCFTRAL